MNLDEKQEVERLQKRIKDIKGTPIRRAKKLPVAITQEEFIEIIKATRQEHHKLSFLLAFGSGLRISEALNVEPRDVDMQNKTIFVRQGKGRKDRIVPMPKGFKQKHLAILPIKCKQRALQVAFKNAAKKTKLTERKPTIHFHSLRHGFGTRLANQGVPPHHIRTMMGHSNISTTNIYLELNPKEALRKYEELF